MTYLIENIHGQKFITSGHPDGNTVATTFGTFTDGVNKVTGAKIIHQGTEECIKKIVLLLQGGINQ